MPLVAQEHRATQALVTDGEDYDCTEKYTQPIIGKHATDQGKSLLSEYGPNRYVQVVNRLREAKR